MKKVSRIVLVVAGILVVGTAVLRFMILEMMIFIPVGISLVLLAAKFYKTATVILTLVGCFIGAMFYSISQPFIKPAAGQFTGTVVSADPAVEANDTTVAEFRISKAPKKLDRHLQDFINHGMPFTLVQNKEVKINDIGGNYLPYHDERVSTGSVLSIRGQIQTGNLLLTTLGNSTSTGTIPTRRLVLRVENLIDTGKSPYSPLVR